MTKTRTFPAVIARRSRSAFLAAFVVLAGATSCVSENVETGEAIPRGDQRYPWDTVVEKAKKLEKGMTKTQVMMLLGSPAEVDKEDNLWIYLPERYAILVPAEALRLEFKETVLADFGYRPIVLGARL